MNGYTLIGIILLTVAAIVLVPLALIWSVNTLFPSTAIDYTLATWAAMLLISATLSARAGK